MRLRSIGPRLPLSRMRIGTAFGFHYVYILQSAVDPDRKYVGFTSNLRRRLHQHNRGLSAYTSQYMPWTVRVGVAFRDRTAALAFERYLKSHSGRAFAKRHF